MDTVTSNAEMKFTRTVLLLWLSLLVQIEAKNWDLNFNFTGYTARARLLMTNCNLDVKSYINLVLGQVLKTYAVVEPSTNFLSPHISCVDDTTMSKAMKFTIYAGDNDVSSGLIDRQRLEMVVSGNSQSVLKAAENSDYIYAWWFHLKSDLSVTDNFFHIFRLKADDGVSDDKDTLLTMTLTRRHGLHLRIRDDSSQSVTYQTMLDLQSATDKWIQAFVQVQYRSTTDSQADSDNGSVRIILKDINGKVLYPPKQDTGLYVLSTFPQGTDYVAPKWGFYRQFSQDFLFHASDWQLFQNVNIWKKN